MRRLYDVHGLGLEVRGGDDRLAAVLDSYLSPFAVSSLDLPDYQLKVSEAPCDAPPADAEVIHNGEVLPGIPARVMRLNAVRWYWIPGRLLIRIGTGQQLEQHGAEIHVAPDCDHNLLVYCAIHVLDASFSEAGQFLLHGAALVLPGTDQALLLFAPSGYGKTTTALALALAGFALMTDDAIVLRRPKDQDGGNDWSAWGLPRALKVHQRTAKMLAPIEPLLRGSWDEHGEQVLTTETLATAAKVASAQSFPVAAVAILGTRTGAQHAISRLLKPKALQILAEDNISYAPGGVPSDYLVKFDALSALVRTVPTFKIRVGADLSSLANSVLAKIADPNAQR